MTLTLLTIYLLITLFLLQFVGNKRGDCTWEVALFWPILLPLAIWHSK